MKKFMSILLAGMMATSAFAINASAIISDSYTVIEGAADEHVAVDQKFDGINTTDFVEGDFGFANITEDGAINLTAKDADQEDGTINKVYAKGPMHIGASKDVARGQYVMEFDITKNDALVGHQSTDTTVDPTGYNYGVFVTVKRPGNEGTALEKYSVFIPVCVNTQGGTYHYKIIYDEAAALAALEADGKDTITGNADSVKYGAKLMTVCEMAPGATNYTVKSSVSSYGLNTALNGRVRFNFGNNAEGAFDTFNLFFSTGAAMGDYNFDESNYTLDNIKIYAPAIKGVEKTYNYDIKSGAVSGTDVAGKALTISNGGSTRVLYDDETHGDRYVMTMDAVNLVVGQPLTINMASDLYSTSGTHVKSTEEIKDKWYTYKFYFELSNYTGQGRMTAVEGYRKEFGSDTWEALTLGEDYIADRTGLMKGDLKNFVQTILWTNVKSYGEFTEGEWTVKNIQVVPDTAICGNAEIVDGEIVADFNITANGARTAYAVTYNEGMIVDAKMFAIPEHAETFNIKLPYDAANVDAATLYVWDNSATPKLDIVDLVAAVK